MPLELTALLIITYATNCNTSGSFAPGVNGNIVKEQSCLVTRTISCNHTCANGDVIKFEKIEDYAVFGLSFDAAGQVVSQTPCRLVNAPSQRPGTPLLNLPVAPNPPLPPTPRPGFVPLTLPIPAAPMPAVIPAPPVPLPPLPAQRAVP